MIWKQIIKLNVSEAISKVIKKRCDFSILYVSCAENFYTANVPYMQQFTLKGEKNDAIKRIHSHSIGNSPFLFDVGFIILFAFLEIEFIMSSFQFWIVLCFARMFFFISLSSVQWTLFLIRIERHKSTDDNVQA